MEGHTPPRLSSVELLPIELIQDVLSALPDLQSLRSAAVCCPSLFYAFKGAENIITTRVLSTQIGNDVLPEAIAALESSRLQSYSRESIHDFAMVHLYQRRPPSKSWTLDYVLPAGKFHVCVAGFTQLIVFNILSKEPFGGPKYYSPTETEICRFQRALYRFEVYRNLFHESNSIEEQKSIFFANFSPWENEQLGCIHDALVRAVSPAFNDIAEHDIAWGEFMVEYGDCIDSEYIQQLLSLGLEKLYQIATAETYEARHQLIYNPRSNCAKIRLNFLYDALDEVNEEDDGLYLSDFTLNDDRSHITSTFFDDPDIGPAKVWRWAHEDETRRNFVYQNNRRGLRQWAYIMWDWHRLNDLGVFRNPWDMDDAWTALRIDYHQEERLFAEMQTSWEERSKVYRVGGRGWWSFGDCSKVVWKDGKAPHAAGPCTPAPVTPISLEHARDTLRLIKLPSSVTKFSNR